MASTAAVGIDGGFTTISGYNGIYFAWSGQISQPVTETTGYSSTFRDYRGGVMGMTFTAQGTPKFDAASHAPVPDSTDTMLLTKASAAITLQVATACTYGGNALIETTDISTDLRSNDSSLSQSGKFCGTITQVWDET